MTFQEEARLRNESEELYCVTELLNKLNVPTQDENGRDYSTVGRILELIRMAEHSLYPSRQLSSTDFINHTIKKSINGK